MGMIIATDDKGVKIWRDDKGQFPRYSYSISKKGEDGKYINCYQDVRFAKGAEVPNGATIQIKKAFMSFNVGKDNKKYPYLMVQEYTMMGADQMIDIPDAPDGEDTVPFN